MGFRVDDTGAEGAAMVFFLAFVCLIAWGAWELVAYAFRVLT